MLGVSTVGGSDHILGLNDYFSTHSMNAFGAVATMECRDACAVPTPEIRVHNLLFDLDAYTNGLGDGTGYTGIKIPKPLFHLKIFGSRRQRYLALAVHRTEAHLVRMLRVILDKSVSTHSCAIICELSLITSALRGGYAIVGVCLSVSLFVS